MIEKPWIDTLKDSIASHDRQIGELTDRIVAQTANIDKLAAMRNRDGLQKRLDKLEGGPA